MNEKFHQAVTFLYAELFMPLNYKYLKYVASMKAAEW